MISRTRLVILVLGSLLLIGAAVLYVSGRGVWYPAYLAVVGKRTVGEAVAEHEREAVIRLLPYFLAAGVAYPPDEVAFLASKRERVLEVWARSSSDYRLIREYEIKGMSGSAGPKLREGDRQVPEGTYRIVALNPNSAFHLSLKLDYPNEFDLRHAQAEGRTEPGSNIFIHGKSSSIGCLAMGDLAIEELFVLVAHVGMGAVRVVIAPHDPRQEPLTAQSPASPPWTSELYRMISDEFSKFGGAET